MENQNLKIKKQKEMVEKLYKSFETGNTTGIESIVAANVKEHTPDPSSKSKGIQYTKDQIELYHTAFPDMKIKIKECFGDGEKLTVFATFSGTNKGAMMGIPATNKKVSIDGIDILKFEKDKITEHWGIYDNLGMFKQLGLMHEFSEMEEQESRR